MYFCKKLEKMFICFVIFIVTQSGKGMQSQTNPEKNFELLQIKSFKRLVWSCSRDHAMIYYNERMQLYFQTIHLDKGELLEAEMLCLV